MVPLALEAMQTEHEADRTTSLIMDSAEARACIQTGDMLARLGEVMRGLGSIRRVCGAISTSVEG